MVGKCYKRASQIDSVILTLWCFFWLIPETSSTSTEVTNVYAFLLNCFRKCFFPMVGVRLLPILHSRVWCEFGSTFRSTVFLANYTMPQQLILSPCDTRTTIFVIIAVMTQC